MKATSGTLLTLVLVTCVLPSTGVSQPRQPAQPLDREAGLSSRSIEANFPYPPL